MCSDNDIVWKECSVEMPPDDKSEIIYDRGINKFTGFDSLSVTTGSAMHTVNNLFPEDSQKKLNSRTRWTEYTPEKWEIISKGRNPDVRLLR